MADSGEVIEKQLQERKVKRDGDVIELYLAKNQLKTICDLSRFRNLQVLYINDNKLRSITCLGKNLRLQELYAHNNELVTITGALEHLTNLETLCLHNNQLQKLEVVVHELRKLNKLKTVNLFHNPVVQEPEYRLYMIFHVPSLQLLDRKEILKIEKDAAAKTYNPTRIEVEDKIAFGLRSVGPPSIYFPSQPRLENTVPADYEVGNNFYRSNSEEIQEDNQAGEVDKNGSDTARSRVQTSCNATLGTHHEQCHCVNPHLSPPFDSDDDAITIRHLRRSVMEYTLFDWKKVPRSEEKRLAKEEFMRPQTITTQFR